MDALAEHLQQVHVGGGGSGGGKKDEFKMTKDEADRLRSALEKPEFREMLMEYAAELEDPKYKAEQDAYLRQVESEGRAKEVYGEGVELVVPTAGFCVRTTVVVSSAGGGSGGAGGEKAGKAKGKATGKAKGKAKGTGGVLYLNVVQSDAIKEAAQPQSGQNWEVPYALNVLNVMPGGREGAGSEAQSQCVDFAVHPGTLGHCSKSSKVRDFMVELALDAVEERDGLVASRAFEAVTDKKYVGLGDTPQVITTRRKPGTGAAAGAAAGAGRGELLGDGKSRVEPVGTRQGGGGGGGGSGGGSGGGVAAVRKDKDGGSFKVPGFSFDRKKGMSAREDELARRAARREEEAAAEREGREIAPEVELVHQGTYDIQDTWRDGELEGGGGVRPKALVVRVRLPRCGGTIKGVDLDINERVVALHAPGKYRLDFELPYEVDDAKGQAKFDKSKDLLTITLPVVPPPRRERRPAAPAAAGAAAVEGEEEEVKEDTATEGGKPDRVEKGRREELEDPMGAASSATTTTSTAASEARVANPDFTAWLKKGSEAFVDPRKVREEAEAEAARSRAAKHAVDPAEKVAAERAVEAAPIDLPSELTGSFLACRAFAGARQGYVFKAGDEGLGYYLDACPAPAATLRPSAAAADVTRAAQAAAKSSTPAPTAFQSLEPKLSGDMEFELD